jgi:hypothetical protein
MRELLVWLTALQLTQLKAWQVVCQAQLAKALQASKELEALRVASFIEAGKLLKAAEREEQHRVRVEQARANIQADLQAKRHAYVRANAGKC